MYTFQERHEGLDSAYINEAIVRLVKKDYGISYNVERTKNKNSINYRFIRNPSAVDSADMYKMIIGMIAKAYPLTYEIHEGNDMIYYSIKGPIMDSALALFPLFRHMLKDSKDKKQWVIDTSGKNVREARRTED